MTALEQIETKSPSRVLLSAYFAARDCRAQKCTLPVKPSQTTQTALDHWPKIATITGKQTASVQSNPETYLDLWCTTVGISI